MKTLIWLLLLAVFAAVAFVLLKRRGNPSGALDEWPFYAKRPLSLPEQVLYYRLVKALPDHIILAQVQVSRVLGVKKGFNFHEWNNRINRMSYDFVVCSKDSTVLAAIELDDKSHDTGGRSATDGKKDRATAAAGVRLVRWKVSQLPDDRSIAALFDGQAVEVLKPASQVVRPLVR